MFGDPHTHIAQTQKLAKALSKSEIYKWLVTQGYFPESYVMPPCFKVNVHPKYGRIFFKAKKKYKPKAAELRSIHFPKTELTDKTFGIIDPELHSDIACLIAQNWHTLVARLFHKDNKVCSYSFPLPLDARNPGTIGRLRSGRMIYEFIEMAENDLAAMAYNHGFIVKTDIKNFYPSIYTHSIAWALHGKKRIRKVANRFNYSFFGNRLDSLFRNANDECTNGIPIGPVVSDVIAELILAAVDRIVSGCFSSDEALVVRFKDDYRILCKNETVGRKIVKKLQFALKEYNLELNDAKTEQHTLPDGLFRPWVSMYHAVNPDPKRFYVYKRFKETYLAVVNIDAKCPGTGVIDRFLADIITKKGRLRVQVNRRTLPRVVSLLLMLGRLRVKAFPKVLAIIELILHSQVGQQQQQFISAHLDQLLANLATSEDESRYLIMWIVYFIRANALPSATLSRLKLKDATVRSVKTSRNALYKECKDFNLFTGVRTIARHVNMLDHLAVFKPQ